MTENEKYLIIQVSKNNGENAMLKKLIDWNAKIKNTDFRTDERYQCECETCQETRKFDKELAEKRKIKND